MTITHPFTLKIQSTSVAADSLRHSKEGFHRLRAGLRAAGLAVLGMLALNSVACSNEETSVSVGQDTVKEQRLADTIMLRCEALAHSYRQECSPLGTPALSSEDALVCAGSLLADENAPTSPYEAESCCSKLGERAIIGNRMVRMCQQIHSEPTNKLKDRECNGSGNDWGTGNLKGARVSDCVMRFAKNGRNILVRDNHAFLGFGSTRAEAPEVFATDAELLEGEARHDTYTAGSLFYTERAAARYSFLPSRMRSATVDELTEMRGLFPQTFAAVPEFDEVYVVTDAWAYIAFRATAPVLPGGFGVGGFF